MNATTKIEAVRTAVSSAQGGWIGLDWTGTYMVQGSDEPYYLGDCSAAHAQGQADEHDGTDLGRAWAQCARDAVRAEEAAERAEQAAMQALSSLDDAEAAVTAGEYTSALEDAASSMEDAASEERAYGDDPCWGPAALLARQLADEADEDEDEDAE